MQKLFTNYESKVYQNWLPSGMFKLFSVVYSYFMQKIFGHLHLNLCLVTIKYLDTFCELEEN